MKIAASICTYEDSGFLTETIRRIYPLVDLIMVQIGSQPWNAPGDPVYPALALQTAIAIPDPGRKIRTISSTWETEAEERNAGLRYAEKQGCDWLLIIDDDELFNRNELARLLKVADGNRTVGLINVQWQVYWKDRDTVISDLIGSMPTMLRAVPACRFVEDRLPEFVGSRVDVPPDVCICHHMSYVRTDAQMRRRVERFSPAHKAIPSWYDRVWMPWRPSWGNLHPVNPESFPSTMPASQSRYQLEPIPDFATSTGQETVGVIPGPKPTEEPIQLPDPTLPRPLLSLCMIVKDEEAVLARCLDSVRGIPDEVVIVDTGSTDRTIEIAASYGATVGTFEWCDDFSKARNFSFSGARGQWIMWLDADDVVLPEDRERLLALKEQLKNDTADTYLMTYNYAQDEFNNPLLTFMRDRIVRNGMGIHWVEPIHEHLTFPPGIRQGMTNITITHRRTHDGAERDLNRNVPMLTKALEKDPENQRLKLYLAKDLAARLQWDQSELYLLDYLEGDDWHDNRVNAIQMLANAQLAQQKHDAAIDTALRGIKLDPRWAEFYNAIGHAYYDQKQWDRAIPWYELAATREVPGTAAMVLMENYTWIPQDRLTQCYAECGRWVEAHQAAVKALTFRPGDGRLRLNVEVVRDRLFPGRTDLAPVRLNLGSGIKPEPSYRSTDLHALPGVAEVYDQGRIPYRDGMVQALYSEHALEHATGHQAALDVIAEWARVLKYGGTLTVKVPDLMACCRALYFGTTEEERLWFRATLYGIQQSNDGEPAESQFHQTGFWTTSLRKSLEHHGFEVQSIEDYDGWGTPSLIAEAVQVQKPLRVRWLVSGIGEWFGPHRIRIYNVHRWMLEHGVDSRVITNYRDNPELSNLIGDCDVLVLWHALDTEEEIASLYRRRGTVVIYDWCEDIDDGTRDACLSAVHEIVCCSTALAEKVKHLGPTTVIKDAYETPPTPLSHQYRTHGEGGKVRVTWCGMKQNIGPLIPLERIIHELGMELRIITNHEDPTNLPEGHVDWQQDRWLYDLEDSDIVICPQVENSCKSNNRATQAMALGIPVLASPILAYIELPDTASSSSLLLPKSTAEWRHDLEFLRSQPIRERIGQAGRAAVIQAFSIDAIGQQWLDLMKRLCRQHNSPESVDIIIPTWNNLDYLKVTIESVRANTFWPHRIIVVNSGTDGTEAWCRAQRDVVLLQCDHRKHFGAACNLGIEAGSAPYVCLLNDDTVVGRGWLNALMHEAQKPDVGAVGPFSNCDQGWTHNETIEIAGQTLKTGMTLDEVRGIIHEIPKYQHARQVHHRDWIAFYAVVMPRAVLKELGRIDDEFSDGCEDIDLCDKMIQDSLKVVQTYESWVFHFGARTRKNPDKLPAAEIAAAEMANQERLIGKKLAHPNGNGTVRLPYLVGIYCGPGWEKWGPQSITEGGIGGSETAAIKVAEEFARRGWRTMVFAEHTGIVNGVEYIHHNAFNRGLQAFSYDLFISSRTMHPFSGDLNAKAALVWVHDVWLSGPDPVQIDHDKVDGFLVLSDWHRDFFSNHHSIPTDKCHVVWNGIDHELFKPEFAPKRESGRLIYSSSPDRGLDILLGMWPRLQAEAGAKSLHVFYGFDNWEKAAKATGNRESLTWLSAVKEALKQPGVHYHGRIGQDDLAIEWLKSSLWLYPTYFTETFSISAAEAMAAGVPVVTSAMAGLTTTVGAAGILIDAHPNSKEYQDQAVRWASCILNQPGLARDQAQKGLRRAARYTWSGLVDRMLEIANIKAEQPRLAEEVAV
jgi:glycosyltransferase involved in cell wall biosynthesis